MIAMTTQDNSNGDGKNSKVQSTNLTDSVMTLTFKYLSGSNLYSFFLHLA
jgi:hypothetical protein